MRYLTTACVAALTCHPAFAAVQVFKASGTFENGAVLSGTVSVDFQSQDPGQAVDLRIKEANDFIKIDSILGLASFYQGGVLFLETYHDCCSNIFLFGTDFRSIADRGKIFSLTYPGFGWSASSYTTDGGSLVRLSYGRLTPSAVPEPAAWVLTILGFGVIGTVKRRYNRQRVSVSFG